MNKANILKALKRHHRLYFAEHDGAIWMTNSYWLLRPDPDGLIVDLLADYNLTLEPMACEVWSTIRRTSGEAPDVGKLLKGANKGEPIVRYALGGMPIHVEVDGRPAEVWKAGERYITVDADFRQFVEAMTGADRWVSTGPESKPVSALDDKAHVGLLMPIRTLLSDAAVPKAA